MMPPLLCLSLLLSFLLHKGNDIKIAPRHDFRLFGEKMFGDYDRKWSWFFRVGGKMWMVEYRRYALRVGYNIDSILREGTDGGTSLCQDGGTYFWLWRQAICLLIRTYSEKVGFYTAYEYLEELDGYRSGADHFLSAGVYFLF